MYGIQTRDITLLPIGGVARLERMPRDPFQEFVVAIAGPAVNVLIAVLLSLLLAPRFGVQELIALPTGESHFLQRVMFVNLVLVVFNLIPAFPMDGGRVLRSFLAVFMDYVAATRIAATMGKICAVGFGLLGLANPMLLLLAGFIFLSASAESRQTELLERLRGWQVKDAMTRDFRAVAAAAPIAECAASLLNSPQGDFPVIDDGRLVGMLRRRKLLQAIQLENATTIGDIADTSGTALNELAPLSSAFETLSSHPHQTVIPVTREHLLIGLIDVPRAVDVVTARSRLDASSIDAPALLPRHRLPLGA
jgi:stage IV sporulation protein FB